jgi:hypothetical protein
MSLPMNLMMKCPLCTKFFSPDPGVVEIEIRVKGELGGDRSRNLYCVSCGKLITEKGVSHWDLVLEEAIRQEIAPKTPMKITEPMIREILINLGASERLTEAVIDHIFGGDGALRKLPEFQSRDRVVGFVIAVTKDLLVL